MKRNPTKTRIEITLSEAAWAGVQSIATEPDITASKLLERVGQGQLEIVDSGVMEAIEDRLDLLTALEAEANPENQERIPWEQVKRELRL